MDTTMRCERCGFVSASYVGHMRHKSFCGNLPLPDDLVDEWYNEGLTHDELAERHNTSRSMIQRRLNLSDKYAGLLKKKKQRAAKELRPYDTQKEPTCKCGLLLSQPIAQPVADGMCKWCWLEEREITWRRLNPFDLVEDGKRMVIEYA